MYNRKWRQGMLIRGTESPDLEQGHAARIHLAPRVRPCNVGDIPGFGFQIGFPGPSPGARKATRKKEKPACSFLSFADEVPGGRRSQEG